MYTLQSTVLIQYLRNFVTKFIKYRQSLNLGNVLQKYVIRSNFRKKHLYTLEGTVLIQSSRNFGKMLMSTKSRSGFKLDHVRSKARSLCHI